jgi:hypothetical protein
VSGTRPFDDDRWSDEDGHACCFWCGRRVDPRDPGRGSYTPNARACEPLPVHLSCMEGNADHMARVQIAAMTAINQMGQNEMKRFREECRCIAPSPPVRW